MEYKKTVRLNVHIMNYADYCIENTLELKNFVKKNNDVSENIYSIRRNAEFENISGEKRKIWHAYGEINYPRTIMLGLDYYCGSIGKWILILKELTPLKSVVRR
jgi:hypothetical protein